jgi:hypothetical protein
MVRRGIFDHGCVFFSAGVTSPPARIIDLRDQTSPLHNPSLCRLYHDVSEHDMGASQVSVGDQTSLPRVGFGRQV